MKRIWMTLLSKSETIAQRLMAQVKGYGLQPDGHFWTDNLEKSMWMGPRAELLDPNTAAWLVVGSKEDLSPRETRYGLSLLSLTVQAKRGNGFPLFLIHGDQETVSPADLPTPLKHAQILPASSTALGAKLVARANTPFKPAAAEYRMDAYGLAGLGNWLEVGPAHGTWKGAMIGVSGEGAEINAHGVGPAGQLPMDKMVLNYAQKGLKIQMGDKEYIAWAVQNQLDEKTSYFVRAAGVPGSIIFGELSQSDETEVFALQIV